MDVAKHQSAHLTFNGGAPQGFRDDEIAYFAFSCSFAFFNSFDRLVVTVIYPGRASCPCCRRLPLGPVQKCIELRIGEVPSRIRATIRRVVTFIYAIVFFFFVVVVVVAVLAGRGRDDLVLFGAVI